MSKMNVNIEVLFRTNYRPLCLYALHYLNDIDAVEDIVQDSFVDLWELLKGGKEIKNVKSYLYTMVKNRSLEKLKQDNLLTDDNILDKEEFEDEDLEERSYIESRLWSAIDSLPERCRDIFLMSKRDGLKYKEIAEELNISIKTVENQMSKALKTLKKGAINMYTFIFC